VLDLFRLGAVARPVGSFEIRTGSQGDRVRYKTHNATTWSIDFERKTLGKFKVILSTGTDIAVTFAILAKKANINKTPRLMDALLSANHDYDYVKVGLDKDGDLFVRVDDWLPTLNARHLKDTINQVANASEEIYVKVADSIRR